MLYGKGSGDCHSPGHLQTFRSVDSSAGIQTRSAVWLPGGSGEASHIFILHGDCLRDYGVVYRCPVPHIDTDRARLAMAASYRAVTADLERLSEAELVRPSRCLGWTRADLLYHMLLDAQRALVTFASPAQGQRMLISFLTGNLSGPALTVMTRMRGSSGGRLPRTSRLWP